MSTVLGRMIQRTRSPLSSLEPLAAPTFAAVPLSEQGWADPVGPAGPLGEAIVAEAGVAVARHKPPPPGRTDQPPGGRPGQRAGARLEGPRLIAGDPTDDLDDFGSEPVPRVLARAPLARSTPVMPGPGRMSRRWSTSKGQLAAANPHPDEDHKPRLDPAAMPAKQASEAPHDGRELEIGEMHTVPPARSAKAPAAGPAEAVAGESVAPEPGAARPAAAVVVERPAPLRPPPAHPPGQWPAPSARPEQAADAFTGSGPEVTISIGHIEVRSAPAAEKPRSRLPFRPQVSLADFLSQDRWP
jgi:hypothetical protein